MASVSTSWIDAASLKIPSLQDLHWLYCFDVAEPNCCSGVHFSRHHCLLVCSITDKQNVSVNINNQSSHGKLCHKYTTQSLIYTFLITILSQICYWDTLLSLTGQKIYIWRKFNLSATLWVEFVYTVLARLIKNCICN